MLYIEPLDKILPEIIKKHNLRNLDELDKLGFAYVKEEEYDISGSDFEKRTHGYNTI